MDERKQEISQIIKTPPPKKKKKETPPPKTVCLVLEYDFFPFLLKYSLFTEKCTNQKYTLR